MAYLSSLYPPCIHLASTLLDTRYLLDKLISGKSHEQQSLFVAFSVV